MKPTKISLGLLFLFLLVLSRLNAQTEFEGGIYNDVAWTKANSPYIVTGNIVVFPEKTLIIEPGATVTFTGDYYLELRGTLIMEGLKEDSIKINSTYLPTLENEWTGIIIDYPQAEFSISYCNFDSLMYAVSIRDHKKVSDNIIISHCVFSNCVFGFTNFATHDPVHIDSCYFSKNLRGIGAERMKITNSRFVDNEVAIFEPAGINISDSEFYRNDIGIELGQDGTVKNCNFEENGLAISSRSVGLILKDNTIQYNDIGLRLLDYFTDAILPIEGNKICNNRLFNVENLDKYNKSVENNCWCTDDSTEIEAKLWDGYDDISIGLLNYDIYDDLCNSKLKSVVKIDLGKEDEETGTISQEESDIEIYPIPIRNFVQIHVTNNKSVPYHLYLHTVDGRLILRKVIREESEILNLSHLEKGIYLIDIFLKNEIIKSQLIIKE